MIDLWWRFEKAAATSMERMALSWLWSKMVCASLCSSSAPERRPMAYWCGLRVVEMLGVICFVMADVTILRNMVPHAMGRILPLGFKSGMMRAEARAFRVSCSTLAFAR